ncbi:MAG: methyl-accepting chemotaxis protein [Spirochaetia bacterium]
MKNISILWKMVIGFGGVILFLSIIGITSFAAINGADQGFVEYRELARDSVLAGNLEAKMLEVRLNVNSFIRAGDTSFTDLYETNLGALEALVAEAQQEIQNPERAALIDEIDTDIDEYNTAFQQVVQLMAQRNDLLNNRLNVIGPEMEQLLSQILVSAEADGDTSAAFYAGVAMRNLLLARLYVVKYVDENLQTYVDRVNSEFQIFNSEISDLDNALQNAERRGLLGQLQNLETEYRAAFSQLVSAVTSRNTITTNTLESIGPEVAADAEAVTLSVQADQDALGPRLQAANARSTFIILTVFALAFVFALAIAVYITRSITVPIKDLLEDFASVAKGDLSTEVKANRKDEIGNLQKNLKSMIRSLYEVVMEIQGSADNVNSGSQSLSSVTQQMSQGSTEQASSAEEVSSSMEQMASNIQQNADNAMQTQKIAQKAAADAETGGEAVSQTVHAMKKIAEKISIIDEIARQTNLLALNAAIEAARAGDQGRGFAVVASEVRKLAERSQRAATEISELSLSSVNVAEEAGQLLEQMVPDIKKTAELVQEISAASSEQNAGANQINSAIMQLDTVIQQNASASEEMASMAEELSSSADSLKNAIGFFRLSKAGYETRLIPETTGVAIPEQGFKSEVVKEPAPAKTEHRVKIDMRQDALDEGFEEF